MTTKGDLRTELATMVPDDNKKHTPIADKARRNLLLIAGVATNTVVLMTIATVMYNTSPAVARPSGSTCEEYKGSLCSDVFRTSFNATQGSYAQLNRCEAFVTVGPSLHQYFNELSAAREMRNSTRRSVACLHHFTFCNTNKTSLALKNAACEQAVANNSYEGEISVPASCSESFYYDNESSLCRPKCGAIKEYWETNMVPIYVLFAIEVVGFIVAMVVSSCNYKRMCRFPPILLIYSLIALTLYLLLPLVKPNCCTSTDYFESLLKPSTICQVQGAVDLLFLCIFVVFGFSHIVILFWAVWFPFEFNYFTVSGRLKWIHTLTVLLCLTIPWIAVILVVVEKGGITTNGLSTRSVFYFYSYRLPWCALNGIGVTLFMLSVYKVIKECISCKSSHIWNCKETQIPYLKLSVVFMYLGAISVLALVQNILEFFRTETDLNDYFLCEAPGNHICTFPTERLLYVVYVIRYAMLSLSPYVSIIYLMMPTQQLKRLMQRLKRFVFVAESEKQTDIMTL